MQDGTYRVWFQCCFTFEFIGCERETSLIEKDVRFKYCHSSTVDQILCNVVCVNINWKVDLNFVMVFDRFEFGEDYRVA